MSQLTEEAEDAIQGNILAGFRKDYQNLIFLRIASFDGLAGWLMSLSSYVASHREVASFNRAFKALRHRHREPSKVIQATWINFGISASGLRKIGLDPALFPDSSFAKGMERSFNDVSNNHYPPGGEPRQPTPGGLGNTSDIILIVAGDNISIIEQVSANLAQNIPKGCQVIAIERGASLPGEMAGHEHFGFKDGISQPKVIGVDAGVAPFKGEAWSIDDFVIPTSPANPLDIFFRNGSFLVYQKLRQDMASWASTTTAIAKEIVTRHGGDLSSTTEAVAAAFIGRTKDGTLVGESPGLAFAPEMTLRCPFGSHVTKSRPEVASDKVCRRIMRRGIPYKYGPSDLGLLFISYQRSIQQQFEYIYHWMNRSGVPASQSGLDPIMGFNEGKKRILKLESSQRQPSQLSAHSCPSFVSLEYGDYFFSPSIPGIAWLSKAIITTK